MATEQEVLQQLVDTNNQLVEMMTADDETDIIINGEPYPSLRKYAKSILFGDLNSIVEEVNTVKDDILATKSLIDNEFYTVKDLATQVQGDKDYIEGLKEQVEINNKDSEHLINDSRALLLTLKHYKETINDYVGKIDKDYNALLKTLQEVNKNLAYTKDLVSKIDRLEKLAQAHMLQASEYANQNINKPVNCWSVDNDNNLVSTTTCDYSARHYYELVKEKAGIFLTMCYEYVPLQTRSGDNQALCVLGSPNPDDEHIDVELRDGSTEEISVRGNA